MNRGSALLAMCVVGVMAAQAVAQRDALKPGDGAPRLDIEEWVAGGPVQIEEGKVYVVVFRDTCSASNTEAASLTSPRSVPSWTLWVWRPMRPAKTRSLG